MTGSPAFIWTLGVRVEESCLSVELSPGSAVLRIDAVNGSDPWELELLESTASQQWMVTLDGIDARLSPCFAEDLGALANAVSVAIHKILPPRIASIAHSALWYETEGHTAGMDDHRAALDSLAQRRMNYKRQIDWVDRSYEEELEFVHSEVDLIRREHPYWSVETIIDSLVCDAESWESHAYWEAMGVAQGSWFGGQREWDIEDEYEVSEVAFETPYDDYRPYDDDDDEKANDQWEGWDDEAAAAYQASFRTYYGPESKVDPWWEGDKSDDDLDYLEASALWDDDIENAWYVDD